MKFSGVPRRKLLIGPVCSGINDFFQLVLAEEEIVLCFGRNSRQRCLHQHSFPAFNPRKFMENGLGLTPRNPQPLHPDYCVQKTPIHTTTKDCMGSSRLNDLEYFVSLHSLSHKSCEACQSRGFFDREATFASKDLDIRDEPQFLVR